MASDGESDWELSDNRTPSVRLVWESRVTQDASSSILAVALKQLIAAETEHERYNLSCIVNAMLLSEYSSLDRDVLMTTLRDRLRERKPLERLVALMILEAMQVLPKDVLHSPEIAGFFSVIRQDSAFTEVEIVQALSRKMGL